MSKLIELCERARETGDWAPLAEAIPYTRFLAVSATSASGELLGTLKFSDRLVGNPSIPALHGGSIGGLLEATAVFELLYAAETVVLPKTINLTVDYLRSGRPVDTFAKARITKRGRRITSVHVEAWQEDRERLIATANAHFLIVPIGAGTADAD